MNDIITNRGEYLLTSFKGDNGIWHLVSSECDDIKAKATACIDTFKNEATGFFKPIPRAEVFSKAESGIIWPLNYVAPSGKTTLNNTLF